MNVQPIIEAAEKLNVAIVATFDPIERGELGNIRDKLIVKLKKRGVFISAEPKAKAASHATSARKCPICDGSGQNRFGDRCICTYGGFHPLPTPKPPIMDDDDTRRDLEKLCFEQKGKIETLSFDLHEAIAERDQLRSELNESETKRETLTNENDAWRVDSQMLADICNLLTEAMPGFKGVPSTPEWTVAAVRELLEQRAALQGVAHRAAVRLEAGKLEVVRENSPLAKDLRAAVNRVNKTLREA